LPIIHGLKLRIAFSSGRFSVVGRPGGEVSLIPS
jgi:hypothetical protein